MLGEIRLAVAGHDLATVVRQAHTIVRVAGDFVAKGVEDADRRLEALAEAGDFSNAADEACGVTSGGSIV